jgi:hypothetical protein
MSGIGPMEIHPTGLFHRPSQGVLPVTIHEPIKLFRGKRMPGLTIDTTAGTARDFLTGEMVPPVLSARCSKSIFSSVFRSFSSTYENECVRNLVSRQGTVTHTSLVSRSLYILSIICILSSISWATSSRVSVSIIAALISASYN